MEDALWLVVLHVQRTMNAAPPLLDGWALDVKELSIAFDALEADRQYCGAALDYSVRIAYALRLEAPAANLAQVLPCEHIGGA
jgi:hypothetical protein